MGLEQERTGIQKKFFDLCSKVVIAEGFSLYDVEYILGSKTLRVFIMDKYTNTAQLDDCVKVDKALTPYIEQEEWMPESLILEVSSPGIFRVLKTVEHFEKAIGESVDLVLFKSLDAPELPKEIKGNKKIRVRLVAVESNSLNIEIENFKHCVYFENIKKASLATDIN